MKEEVPGSFVSVEPNCGYCEEVSKSGAFIWIAASTAAVDEPGALLLSKSKFRWFLFLFLLEEKEEGEALDVIFVESCVVGSDKFW
ncbi:hypothetical protein AX774_g3727 [Zancudomyces culisetae]|uniref:Uncharacterized protein n=1 Tax=Zancudomyces culisetae TaxID=1213189 RepID=A0A1R1PP77_ZANCU|nr:hypothetical protein AX774_g3727 [Zancudomyces culisetae]|eukprot:OMH82786.1 hypothetical protein AX774_g3727 [Zancudomyces culisetae]